MELLCIVDDHCSFVDVKNSFTLRALHHRLSVSVDFLYHQGDFRILTDDNSDESKETKKKKCWQKPTPECYHCVVVHCMLLRKSNRFSVELYLYACCLLLSEIILKNLRTFFKMLQRVRRSTTVTNRLLNLPCYLIMLSYHIIFSARIHTKRHAQVI